jgi:hypothetical protein
MDEMQIKVERMTEAAVAKMKEQGGSMKLSTHKDLFENNEDYIKRVSRRLISANLSMLIPQNDYPHTLTNKGWEFTTFENYRKGQQFQKDLLQANYDTQKSIQSLNTETVTFYTKQKEYNKTQRNLTWIIAVAGGIYTIIAAATFFKSYSERNAEHPQGKHIQLQMKLQSIDSTLKSQINPDSSFQK